MRPATSLTPQYGISTLGIYQYHANGKELSVKPTIYLSQLKISNFLKIQITHVSESIICNQAATQMSAPKDATRTRYFRIPTSMNLAFRTNG